MNSKTTIWGAVAAVGTAAFAYLQAGGDFRSPAFWAGFVASIGIGLKGYFSADAK